MDLPHHGAASAEAGCFDLLLKSTWKRGGNRNLGNCE